VDGDLVTGKPETACRVCGLDDGEELYDKYGVPQYIICECCGNESGIGDEELSQVRELRGFWVARGAPWHWPADKPAGWNVLEQMSNLPEEWR
jgi:hypothetical protein